MLCAGDELRSHWPGERGVVSDNEGCNETWQWKFEPRGADFSVPTSAGPRQQQSYTVVGEPGERHGLHWRSKGAVGFGAQQIHSVRSGFELQLPEQMLLTILVQPSGLYPCQALAPSRLASHRQLPIDRFCGGGGGDGGQQERAEHKPVRT